MNKTDQEILSAAAKIQGKKSALKFKQKFPSKKERSNEMKRIRKIRTEKLSTGA